MKELLLTHEGKHFFFDDPVLVADYIRKNFPETVRTITYLADEIVEKRFHFNLRWDMERTSVPVCFTGDIVWNHQPGDDPEWIYAFNRMRYWITLGQAYALTGDEKYAKSFVDQMCHWVKTAKQKDPAYAPCWRSIEVGLRMEYWQKAMQYFGRSPSVTEEAAALFVQSMTEHAEFLMDLWNAYNLMSNWGVLANHGLFIAGVMLPESPRTQAYRDEAIDRLNREIQIQTYRDGLQWEQSPMYHNEVLQCYLDVLLLAGRNGIKLPEEMTRRVKRMAYVDVFASKPDHNEVSMGDSDQIDQRDLITKAALLFHDGVLKGRGYSVPDFDSAWDMGERGIDEYASIRAEEPSETDRYLSDSGNMYFRSGWEENSSFLHFHCGTLGAGHGHGDQLHFDLFGRGEDLLIDSGRFSYVFGEKRASYKAISAHNTIRVDGIDLYVPEDSWASSRLTRAINRRFYSDKKYGYAEGGHTGYLKYAASPMFVNRRILYLKPDIVVIADEFYGNASHVYEQFFHFNNAGALTGSGAAYQYQSGRLQAEIAFVTPRISTGIHKGSLSRRYNEEEENSVLVTRFRGGFVCAYTVIGLSDPGKGSTLHVEKKDVLSNFKQTVFSDDVIEALNIRYGEYAYTVVIAHEEYASPTDTFLADGCTGFGNAVVFDRSAGENEIGTVLLY